MTTRVLFRFHKNFDVCAQNLRVLRMLNPRTPIDGMYGGDGNLDDIPADLRGLLDSLWSIPVEDPYYKWKNGDLCVRWWFRDKGHALPFSHLCLVEWDLLFLKPVAELFGALEPGCNYASIFGDCTHAKKIGWYWIREQFGEEVNSLLRHLEETKRPIDFDALSFAIMNGCVFSRSFLEKYVAEPVSSHSNDELRLSAYSAAYGIPLLNNGIRSNPNNRINAENREYGEKDLDAVLAAGGGAIHPLRIIVNGIEDKIRRSGKA